MGENNDNNNNNNGRAWSCCNDEQTLFGLFYFAFVILAFLTWRTLIAKPMRLIAVFIHEWSHATACWLSGGHVHAIQVFDNEGGVTQYHGGCRSLIIPAGYVGCAFWAMILVILSGGRKTSTFAAVCFTLALLAALCYSPNRTLVYINLAYAAITIIFIVVEWRFYTPILPFVILFYGVFVGVFAIADIYQDTIKREVAQSDASACHAEVCRCCPPRCIGIQWALLAIIFQWLGIWIAIVEMSDECADLGWFQCLNLSLNIDNFNFFDERWDFDGFWEQGP